MVKTKKPTIDTMTQQKPKNVIGLYREPCVICKKTCYYVLVTQEGKQAMMEIHALCSAKCEQAFRQSIQKGGFEKTASEEIKAVKGYDKVRVPHKE